MNGLTAKNAKSAKRKTCEAGTKAAQEKRPGGKQVWGTAPAPNLDWSLYAISRASTVAACAATPCLDVAFK
jgi:hypothetical protein